MIKKTKYLSQAERETGRRYFYRFAGLNGMGFSFLGNTTVYLMAILYGANNTQLGYISSVMFITGLSLLFYTRIFNGKSIKSVGTTAWFFRGTTALGYLALPFLSGQKAVYLILTIYTLFCISRTLGVAVQQNIQQMISTSRTRGEVVMTSSTRFNTVAIFSRIFSYLVTMTSYFSELTEILFLQVLGFISNTFSFAAFKKIPSREIIEHKKGRHVGSLFLENMKSPRERRILIIRWCSVGIEILGGMTIPFLRKYAGFSAPMVFLYSIIITLAAIIGAQLIRPFADRLGSRPFILPTAVATSVLWIIWMTAHTDRSVEFFYIMGFLSVMAQNMLVLLASRLFIQSIPETDSISFTSMDVFITSILAFILGFLGGALADFSELGTLPFLNVYGLTFFIGVILSLIITITASRFEEAGSVSLKQAWTMLLSVDHLRTFRDINRLNTYNSTLKRKSLLLSLGYSGSSLADDEIRQIFLQPLSDERGEIIKTLFEKKRPDLLPELMREAEDPMGFNREEALFALGAYPDDRVKELLLRLLGDPDNLMASNAAKSLARIGVNEYYRDIWERFLKGLGKSLKSDLNYLIALHKIQPKGDWIEILFDERCLRQGETYFQNMTTLASRQINLNPPLGWIYQKNNDVPGEGMAILLDEAREMQFFHNKRSWMDECFSQKDYSGIWIWCREELNKADFSGTRLPLVKAIENFNLELADPSNTLAAVYFTYQIFKYGGSF